MGGIQPLDDHWLPTVPMLLGGDSRLFEGMADRMRLDLIDGRAMDTGAVLSRHRAAASS